MGRPVRRPEGGTEGRPAWRPQGRPAGGPVRRPQGGTEGKPFRRLRADARDSAAAATPPNDPLAGMKSAWQPAQQWCKKEMREAHFMEPSVKAAVQQFQTLVTGVMAATEDAQFQEAQRAAAAYVREHAFLRWAPIPSVR